MSLEKFFEDYRNCFEWFVFQLVSGGACLFEKEL
jgi:hypothetical protein